MTGVLCNWPSRLAARKARVGAQIDAKLADESWAEVAELASYCAQGRALSLKPWQTPVCEIHDLASALAQPYGDQRGEREAAELLQRMQRLGISKFDPDPVGAIIEAERKAAP